MIAEREDRGRWGAMAWSWGLGPGPVLAAGRAARRGQPSPPVAPRAGGGQARSEVWLLISRTQPAPAWSKQPRSRAAFHTMARADATAGQSSLFSGKAPRLLSCMNPDPWSRLLSCPVSRSEGCFCSPGTCSQACCWAAGPELLPGGCPAPAHKGLVCSSRT